MANPDGKKFCADVAKRGTASCKKCKEKLLKGCLRLGKVVANPFTDAGGEMKQWFHVACLFDTFTRARKTTKKIEHPDDIDGFDDLEQEHKDEILKHIPGGASLALAPKPKAATPRKKSPARTTGSGDDGAGASHDKPATDPKHKDNSFREFRRLCADLANESSYTGKTAIVKKLFEDGTDGDGFKGDIYLWIRLLLPGVVKRVYNLQSKQIIKIISKIFETDSEEMLEHLEQGDVAETIRVFFEKSDTIEPTKKSTLTLHDVDDFLERLTDLTKEEEQAHHFKKIAKRCTSNDLKMIIRLVKHDLRIGAGPKHILEALHPDAYQAFQTSRDINAVISKVLNKEHKGMKKSLSISISLMTPVLPMLAEACKSVEYAMKKCPDGMFAEIKYDGERVQVHKQGNQFKYFSRSLKPVMPHKVAHFKDYIPEAFPHAKDIILDSEVLLIDTVTGQPLPFGTLGKHKRSEFKDANVCLFVFDCLYYNGDVLLDRPIQERRKILGKTMKEIPNHIMFSEMQEIHDPKDLQEMINKVFKHGLEGLVLKNLKSIYEPGKRHWLKVKKDYLLGGAMADSADLLVLGAWYGTGNKGGMMSVFLMGCYDPMWKKWCTVTKVHTGHDDETLERIQDELQVVKISKDQSRVPNWLNCTKTMIPDFVAKDPKDMPVWEITGAEFTKNTVHTADGISVRFPRVTKIRHDKTWKEATTLPELKGLYTTSKKGTDFEAAQTTDAKESKSKESVDSETSTSSEEKLSPTKRRKKDVDEDASTSKKNKNSKHTMKDDSPEVEEEKSSPSKKRKVGSAEEEENTQLPGEGNEAKLYTLKRPLPDVFTGVGMVLADSLDNREELARYFIAFGGKVLESREADKATHVIADQNKLPNLNPRAVKVNIDWLWDSIKLKDRQPTQAYGNRGRS